MDDNATNRAVFAEQLRSWEVDYTVAENGVQALELLRDTSSRHRPYDIVLLDLDMPEMDGMSLAHAIDADTRLAGTHCIMLSSVCHDYSAADFKKANIETYLTKPIRQSELRHCLLSILDGPRDKSTPKATPPANPRLRYEGQILLAEDNLVNQEVALAMLEPLGVSVEVADDGRKALEAWIHGEFSLILMDCQMPNMDGFEATAKIRKYETEHKRKRTRIVALTANALEGDRERCLEGGMDDYLSKPFTEEQIRQVLSGLLGPARSDCGEADIDMADSSGVAVLEVLDTSVLESYRERERNGRVGLLQRIVDAYLQQSEQHIDQLREALANSDPGALQRAAHTLKSSSANVGALTLSALCKQLEEQGRRGKIDGAAEQIVSLIELYEAGCQALVRESSGVAA